MLNEILRDERVNRESGNENLNKVISLKVVKQVIHFSVNFKMRFMLFHVHIPAAFFFSELYQCQSVNFSNCDNKEGSLFEQTVCVLHCFLDFVTTKK